MHSVKILYVVAVAVGFVHATGYGAGGAGAYRGAAAVGVPARAGGYGGGAGGYGAGQSYPPQPYNFDYQAQDEQGNVHYRQEQGDQSGAVRGTYGYTDNQGLYRVVEYVADASGFRANVRTNEPGTGKDAPADVAWTAVEPPAGIQDRYTRGGYGGGYRAGGAAASGSYAGGVVSGAYGGGFRGGAGAKPAGAYSGKSGY